MHEQAKFVGQECCLECMCTLRLTDICVKLGHRLQRLSGENYPIISLRALSNDNSHRGHSTLPRARQEDRPYVA